MKSGSLAMCRFLAFAFALTPVIAFGQEKDVDFLEQIRAEGPSAWIAMEKELAESRFQYEIVEIDTVGKETTRRVKRIQAEIAGGQFLIRETLLPGRDVEVNCRNERYEFTLFGSPENWGVRWQGKGRNPKRAVEAAYDYFVGMVRLPWSIAAVPLAKLIANERFLITQAKRVSKDEIVFDFAVKPADAGAEELQGLSDGHVVIDPTRRWAIHRYRVQYRNGMKDVAELTYGASGPPWISRLALVMEVPPDRRSEFQLAECRYSRQPVDTEQFTLSAFGLSEFGEASPGRRGAVAVIVGVVLVLLGLVFGWCRPRRNAKPELSQ